MYKINSIFLFIGIMLPGKSFNPPDPGTKVMEIHNLALTVDTHCDTPMLLVNESIDPGIRNESPKSRVDLVRMKEGGLDAIFFAAFTGQKERTPENIYQAYKLAHRMIDATQAMCKKYSDLAEIATTSYDASRLEALGKRAVYLGLENGFPVGTDIKRIKEFYDRGVRYITLCHSSNNDICDSSTDNNGPEHNGVSKFGEAVIKEMNRLGIIIDISHISDSSFFDVIRLSKAPVIASHSSVRSIAGHPRNLNDEMILALAAKGGVIQICLLDDYIKTPDKTTEHYKKISELRAIYNEHYDSWSQEEKNEFISKWERTNELYPKKLPSAADLVDHIDYVKKLVGIDYVGIGSDFDGGGGLSDCADVSQFPNITSELLKRGYSQDEIEKIWGGNFFRVFREVENLSQE
jgi:membrane dipeptidase